MLARHRSPQSCLPSLRLTRSHDGASRLSIGTRLAAAVVALGGLTGAAQAAPGSPGLPTAASFGTTANAAEASAAPAPRMSPENAETAATPVADPAVIAALVTPPAGRASASMQHEHVQQAVAAAAAEKKRAASDTSSASAQSASAGAGSIVSGRVTSGFGSRGGGQHNGLDIAAPIGTPIQVPLAGTVLNSGPAGGFGQWVRVEHDDGTITVYGHINRSLVEQGQKVSAGQQVAEVGNRGRSSGPHLHIEVITPDGTKTNPKPWLDKHGFRYT